MQNITGIDEAGRGAVLGPLVIAGVTVRKEDEAKLREMGCKDSKVLKPKRREELAAKIEKVAVNIIVLRVQPCTIDDYRASGQNLDMIEAMKMAQIITMNDDPGTVYVDALSSNPKGFEKKIVGYMKGKKADMVVKNYMDESVVVVSAASIMAKVERDRAIENLKKSAGVDFGVGYPHDKRTTDFIESFVKEKKELPSFVRKSWMTTQNIIEKNWQKKVGEFFSAKKKQGCD
jgi:ribonuclease HII